MRRFEGKICIITGVGGAIGRASALRLASEGATIVGCDIAAAAAEETQALVTQAGGRMISLHPCDITKTAECERLVVTALAHFDRIDVVFNNAASAQLGWIEDITDEAWSDSLHTDLTLVFLLCRAAWPALKQSKGAIVNVASISAWGGLPDLPGLAHTTAKGGVISMTRHLAMEGRTHGIRVNSISPGTIENSHTRMILEHPEWAARQIGRAMNNRMGQPEEVAAALAFLASDDASYVNGVDLRVDGGYGAW